VVMTTGNVSNTLSQGFLYWRGGRTILFGTRIFIYIGVICSGAKFPACLLVFGHMTVKKSNLTEGVLLLIYTPHCIGTLLKSPVSCRLTDPGSLCPGDVVTLTCNVTGGEVQRWLYNTLPIGNSIVASDVLPMSARVDGVNFTLLLLSTMNSPYLASQISFVATERMDGRIVECRTGFPLMSNAAVVSDTTTLRVGSRSECRHRGRGGGGDIPTPRILC
jgi:hypothetical protein